MDGERVTNLGTKIDTRTARVTLDGKPVALAPEPRYFILNKPAGVVTTLSDPEGRPTVTGLFPPDVPGLVAVGRLDMYTKGLLVLTSDGELAHRLMHPRYKVPKHYVATIDGHPDADDIEALRRGVELDDGVTAPADVSDPRIDGTRSNVEITLREGRKRQVRRMFSAVGHPVIDLVRTTFGPLTVEGMELGEVRELTFEEEIAIKTAAGLMAWER